MAVSTSVLQVDVRRCYLVILCQVSVTRDKKKSSTCF